MSDWLRSVFAKIQRADELIRELDAHLSGVDPRTVHVVHVSRNSHNGEDSLGFRINPPPEPELLQVRVGEVLYQLRSCLDHLVGALERVNGLDRDSEYEFPVFWDAGKFKAGAQRKIKGVSASAAARIEGLQPYQRKGFHSYRNHPLWILHDLGNTDKHRVLISITNSMQVNSVAVGVTIRGGRPAIVFPGKEMRWSLTVPVEHRADPNSVPPQMKMPIDISLLVAFSQFGNDTNQPIIPCLQQLRDFVFQLVESFRPEFPT
ncbi:MAG: hypothetical protein Q8T13_21420 [Acidobacteriota bacterium]|nr:hypothetical protein [Acidobacteriota bacterium]